MEMSSLIQGAFYWPDTCALELRFAGGRRYLYLGIPPELADRFAQASSKGAFFNGAIKGRFDCYPLKDDPAPQPRRAERSASLATALRRSLGADRLAAND
jgi:KTSC domain